MPRMLALLVMFLVSTEADAGNTAHLKTNRQVWLIHAEDELEALDALVRGRHAGGAWKRLHDLYRECPDCCENSADESLGWIPATLLAKHWKLIDELDALALKDPAWLGFVLERLHGPIDPKLLRQAARNTKTCPKSHRQLCERIRVNALQAAMDVETPR